jgi:hypothetical protein
MPLAPPAAFAYLLVTVVARDRNQAPQFLLLH